LKLTINIVKPFYFFQNEEPDSYDEFEDALSHKDDIPHVESFADGSSVVSGEVAENDNGSSLPQENNHEDCSAQDEMLSKGIEHVQKKLKSNKHDEAVKEALLVSKHNVNCSRTFINLTVKYSFSTITRKPLTVLQRKSLTGQKILIVTERAI
jgi:hypothetical protein